MRCTFSRPRRTALAVIVGCLLVAGTPTASAAPVGTPLPGGDTGGIVTFGGNADGQSSGPAGLTGVTAISAGYQHTLALTSDGVVHGWGGNSSDHQAVVPTGLPPVVAIAAGGYHSIALTNSGTVVAWGRSGSGQTTVPSGLTGVTAIAAGGAHNLALKNDGTIVAWGTNGDGETTVPSSLSGVTAIAAGGYTSYALDGTGHVTAWGNNLNGQTNVPSGLSGVTAIAAGAFHALALKSDGTVVAWGANSRGQATVPAGLDHVVAVAGGFQHSLAVKDDGTVVAWGANNYLSQTGGATVPVGLTGAVAVTGGLAHSVVLVARPAFTADAPPTTGTTGTPYSYTFTAHGYQTPTFAVTSGSLPTGLALSSAGVLSGTPTTPGSSTFTVSATGFGGTRPGSSHTVVVSAAVPGAPTGVQVTPGAAHLAASWTPPSGGAPVDHYVVTASPGQASCTTTATSCVLGAITGTTYTVTVTAVGANSATGPGASGTGTVPVAAPQVPTAAPVGAPTTLTTVDGQIATIRPSEQIVLVGTGYAAYSSVTLVLHSTPVVLGTATTDGTGSFSQPVTIPAGTAAGAHSLAAYGSDPSGNPRAVRMDVTLAASGGPAVVGLAVTGFEASRVSLGGLLLLLLGGLGSVLSRQRVSVSA